MQAALETPRFAFVECHLFSPSSCLYIIWVALTVKARQGRGPCGGQHRPGFLLEVRHGPYSKPRAQMYYIIRTYITFTRVHTCWDDSEVCNSTFLLTPQATSTYDMYAHSEFIRHSPKYVLSCAGPW